jgi:hypothetical protein
MPTIMSGQASRKIKGKIAYAILMFHLQIDHAGGAPSIAAELLPS